MEILGQEVVDENEEEESVDGCSSKEVCDGDICRDTSYIGECKN